MNVIYLLWKLFSGNQLEDSIPPAAPPPPSAPCYPGCGTGIPK